MPVYEYVCMRCEARFERLQRVGEGEPSCSRCGAASGEVRRQLSVFASARPAGTSSASAACGCGGACACRT